MGSLSLYEYSMLSRKVVLLRGPSPVFSPLLDRYDEYNRRKIIEEITKNEFFGSFFKLFYPFVQNNTDIIKCLSYCPVLSNLLAHSKTPVNLDAFCLDASILFSHGMNISQKPEDKDFIERTSGLSLIDVNDLKPITDPTFNQELQDWNTAYTKRLEEFSAKWPPLTTGEIIEPEEKEIPETPSQKKKKKSNKKRWIEKER